MKLFHTFAIAAVMAVGPVSASYAGHTAKSGKMTAKASAVKYECAHCNIQMTAKEAKAHGMKCSACGAKLTMVKKPTKMAPKSKKA